MQPYSYSAYLYLDNSFMIESVKYMLNIILGFLSSTVNLSDAYDVWLCVLVGGTGEVNFSPQHP